MSREGIEECAKRKDIMLALDDLLVVQSHFRDVLKRDPSVVEMKVLMTYWSDHCRHTTFNTKLKEIIVE